MILIHAEVKRRLDRCLEKQAKKKAFLRSQINSFRLTNTMDRRNWFCYVFSQSVSLLSSSCVGRILRINIQCKKTRGCIRSREQLAWDFVRLEESRIRKIVIALCNDLNYIFNFREIAGKYIFHVSFRRINHSAISYRNCYIYTLFYIHSIK